MYQITMKELNNFKDFKNLIESLKGDILKYKNNYWLLDIKWHLRYLYEYDKWNVIDFSNAYKNDGCIRNASLISTDDILNRYFEFQVFEPFCIPPFNKEHFKEIFEPVKNGELNENINVHTLRRLIINEQIIKVEDFLNINVSQFFIYFCFGINYKEIKKIQIKSINNLCLIDIFQNNKFQNKTVYINQDLLNENTRLKYSLNKI